MTAVIRLRPARPDATDMDPTNENTGASGTRARLRSEHGRTLRRARRVEEMLRSGGAGRMRAVEHRSLRSFAAFLLGAYERHMSAEESVVFPRLEQEFPELGETLRRLRADHDELRAMSRDLERLLSAAPGERRDERLFVLVMDLVELMRLHFHAEEQAVFGWLGRLRAAPAASKRSRGPRRAPSRRRASH